MPVFEAGRPDFKGAGVEFSGAAEPAWVDVIVLCNGKLCERTRYGIGIRVAIVVVFVVPAIAPILLYPLDSVSRRQVYLPARKLYQRRRSKLYRFRFHPYPFLFLVLLLNLQIKT